MKIDLKRIPTLDWVKTGVTVLLYILLIIWVGNPWWLLLLPVVADVYSTRIIPWGFWKKTKDGSKPSALVEWIDAIIFALVAVYFVNLFLFQNYKIPTSSLEKSMLVGDHLFVSKLSYGPRMPNRPFYMPMTQNTLPFFNCKSYLDWPQWEYKRLAGLGNVERNDIVVFNFPAGDTVCVEHDNPDYYEILREVGLSTLSQTGAAPLRNLHNTWERNHYVEEIGRQRINQPSSPLSNIVARPVDKRDCYVKRCIGLPGDTLSIRNNKVFINGEHLEDMPEVQHNYFVKTNDVTLNDRFFENLGISREDRLGGGVAPNYNLPMTKAMVEKVKGMPSIKSIVIDERPADSTGWSVFPFSPDYPWSRDNYGPIWIPQKGATIQLDEVNAVLYERAITAYEGHTLDVKNGKVLVDGQETTSYTFAMDYYFMMGDNRHKSADSRYWGFVPEDHIIGKPLFIFLSTDPDHGGLRMDRFFKTDF